MRPKTELRTFPSPGLEVFSDIHPLTRICSTVGTTRVRPVKARPKLDQSIRPLPYRPRDYQAIFLRRRIFLDTREIYRRTTHQLRQAAAPARLPLYIQVSTLSVHGDPTQKCLPTPPCPTPNPGGSLQILRRTRSQTYRRKRVSARAPKAGFAVKLGASCSQKPETPSKDLMGDVALVYPYFPYYSLVVHTCMSLPCDIYSAIPTCRERSPSCALFQGVLHRRHKQHTGSFPALSFAFPLAHSFTHVRVHVTYIRLDIPCQTDGNVRGNAETREYRSVEPRRTLMIERSFIRND